jgi:hypothetical protein
MHTVYSLHKCETSSICRGYQLFAAYVQQRRLQLGMNCQEAARLAGLSIVQWISLEQEGWIPALGGNAMLAIAGTLETRIDQLNLLATCNS